MAPRDEKSSSTGGTVAHAPAHPANPVMGGEHPATVMAAAGMAKIVVPGGDFLLMAEYVRQGGDLLLVGADGTRVLIQDYFATETPPPLLTESGATIDAALAGKLAGPMAPGQYAQAGGAGGEPAIGKVQTANGSVSVKHADGTQGELHKGDDVLQGDILLTGQGGAVGVVFADGTTMSLGEKGRLVLDALSYDPGDKTGDAHLSLVSGSFALVSGQISKTTPDALQLKTPTMTVGIRGTGLTGNGNTVAMMAEKGGFTGEVSVTTPTGQTLTLNSAGAAAVLGAGGTLVQQQMTPMQVMQVAGNAGAALPNAANLLSTSFVQAAQQVQQQLQQQAPPPPPPPPPPPADQHGQAQPASPLQQLQALHEAQVQGAVQQIKTALAFTQQAAAEVAARVFEHVTADVTAQIARQDAAAAAAAKADYDLAVSEANAAILAANTAKAYVTGSNNDTYDANIYLTSAKAHLASMTAAMGRVVTDSTGHGAAAQAIAASVSSTAVLASGADSASSIVGDADSTITGITSDNLQHWADNSLIDGRVSADTALVSAVATADADKITADVSSTAAHTALLNTVTPFANYAAAQAVEAVQLAARDFTFTNALNAASAYFGADYDPLTVPANPTDSQIQNAILVGEIRAAVALAELSSGNTLALNASAATVSAFLLAAATAPASTTDQALFTAAAALAQASVQAQVTEALANSAVPTGDAATDILIHAVFDMALAASGGAYVVNLPHTAYGYDLTALLTATGFADGDTLLQVWNGALASAQSAFANSDAATGNALVALNTAQQAYIDAQSTAVHDASAYAADLSAVADTSYADSLAIGSERLGEATWQAQYDGVLTSALTSVQQAETASETAAGNATADAAAAAANADAAHLGAAQSARNAASLALGAAQTADDNAASALTSALNALHALGLNADGTAYSGTLPSGFYGAPSHLTSALAADQAAAASAQQAGLSSYKQVAALKAQADQQLSVAQQAYNAAVQSAAQAEFLAGQQNASDIASAMANVNAAVISAHASAAAAASASDKATAAQSSILDILTQLNAAVAPSNLKDAALAIYNASKASLIAVVQADYAATAADAQTAATASTVAGGDIASVDAAKTSADTHQQAVDVSGTITDSQAAVAAANDALTRASAAAAAAKDAAVKLTEASAQLASLATSAATASAAQALTDAKAAAAAALATAHAVLNSGTAATAGTVFDAKAAVAADSTSLTAKLGASTSTDTANLYGLWNAALAAKGLTSTDTAGISTAVNADATFKKIHDALTDAVTQAGIVSGDVTSMTTQVSAATVAVAAVETAAAIVANATSVGSTSSALAQAVQQAQAAQSAASQAAHLQSTADNAVSTVANDLTIAKNAAITVLNTAAQAAGLAAATDAASAQGAAAAVATDAANAQNAATHGNSYLSHTAADYYGNSQTDALTAKTAVGDAVTQVQKALTDAQSSVLGTSSTVLNALNLVAQDEVTYNAALRAFDAGTGTQAAVTAALAQVNTHLATAQNEVATANATAATAGIAANETLRAEQAVVTAGTAYLQALQSRTAAAAAVTLAANPGSLIAYYQSLYNNAILAAISAQTLADGAVITAAGWQTKAHAAALDLTDFLSHTSSIAQGNTDPAGIAKASALNADTTATSVQSTITAKAGIVDGLVNPILGNANQSAAAAAFNGSDIAVAQGYADAAVAAANSATTASATVQQLITLAQQAANTAITQDTAVRAIGDALAAPVGQNAIVYEAAQTGAHTFSLTNVLRSDGTQLFGTGHNTGYVATITATNGGHGSVTVDTSSGTPQFIYTATSGFTGKDSFTYTVTNTDTVTNVVSTATGQVTVNVEGATIATSVPATVLENAAAGASFSLTVSDTNANESVTGVTVTGLPPGTVLTVVGTSTVITSTSLAGVYTISAAALTGKTITVMPPADFSGSVGLVISATIHDSAVGAVADVTTTQNVAVTVTPVTQGATITPSATTVSGTENLPVSFTLQVADSHTNETVSSVSISGLAGATMTVGGTSFTPNALGVVTLTAAANAAALAALVAGAAVTVTLPNAFGIHSLVVSATAANGSAAALTTSQTIQLNLAQVPLTALQASTSLLSSGNTLVSDTADNIAAIGIGVLQKHGISTIDISSGTLMVNAIQAQNVTFTKASGSHLQVTDSIANVTAVGVATLVGHGVDTLILTGAGTLTLTAAQAAALILDPGANGHLQVADTAAGINAATVAVLQGHGITIVDVTNSGTVTVTAGQAKDITFTKSGGGHVAISDTAANLTASALSVGQSHGVDTVVLTDAGTVALTVAQAQGLTLSATGGGHFSATDTATALNAAGMAALETRGISEFVLTSAGTLSLSGGAGTATLTGSSGSDTYVLPATEAGTLTLIDTGGTNILNGAALLDGGFQGAEQVGNDLLLHLSAGAGGGSMLVKNQFAGTGAGIDHVVTGSGDHPNVTFVGAVGAATTLTGGTGEEVFVANAAVTTMIGGGGRDTFFLADANQTITGDTTTQSGNGGMVGGVADFTYVGAGVTLSTLSSAVFGGHTTSLNAINRVVGSAFNDTLNGGNATDLVLEGGAGNNTLIGGSGSVTASYKHSSGIIANLSSAALTVGSNTVAAGTVLNGFGGTDTLTNIHAIQGSSGNDVIKAGNTGAYILDGGLGTDTLIGGNGNTQFRTSLAGGSTLTGGTGINSVTFSDFNGGTLSDSAFAHISNVAVVDLYGDNTATAASLTLGSAAAAAGVSVVDAMGFGAGVTLNAATRSSAVTLMGGAGNDTLIGGTGMNALTEQGTLAGATITVSGATTTITGVGGTDTVVGTSQFLSFYDGALAVVNGGATVVGSSGNDHLVIGAATSTVFSNGGNDFISAATGNHTFAFDGLGLDSHDTISGGTGHNTLSLTGLYADVADAAFSHITGVERLNLGAALSDGTITLGSAAGASGITTVDASAVGMMAGVTVNASATTTGLNLIAGGGFETFIGGSGADTFTAGSGNAVFKGGAGADTAILQGSAANYTFTASETGNVVAVNSVTGTTTTLSGVETVQFTGGGSLTVAAAGTSGLTLAGAAGSGISLIDSHVAHVTMEVWVKFNTLPTSGLPGNVFGRTNSWNQATQIEDSTGGYTHTVSIDPSTHTLISYVAGGGTSSGSQVIQTGQWYHITQTVDYQGNSQLYVNGVADGAPLTVSATYPDETNVILGSAHHTMAPMDSEYGTIAIWDSARSATQIQADMNSTLGPTTGLVGLWNAGSASGGVIPELSGAAGASAAAENNATVSVSGPFVLTGTSGSDVLHAGSGIAVLDAGSGGSDTLTGGAAGTLFRLNGGLDATDTVTGGAGNDILQVSGGTIGDAAFAHVSGVETLSLAGATTLTLGTKAQAAGFTTVDASANTGATTITVQGDSAVQTVIGGSGNDVFQFGSLGSAWTGSASTGTSSISAIGGPANLVNYDYNAHSFDAVWDARTTVGAAGTMDLHWHYSGFHAWFEASASIDLLINGVVVTTLQANTAVGGGFDWSGDTSVTVNAGDILDFHMTGSNFDSANLLQGHLEVSYGAVAVNGGAGTDTLAVSGASTISDRYFATVQNTEVLQLTNAAAMGHVTLGALSQAAGIVQVDASATTLGIGIDASVRTDSVVLTGGAGADNFIVGAAQLAGDTISGGAGSDLLTLAGTASLTDSAFAHVSGVESLALTGGSIGVAQSMVLGANAAAAGITAVNGQGSLGNLTIDASADSSVHTLFGGFGDDTLIAGASGATLTGGAGADSFVIAANAGTAGVPEVITDFAAGIDKINVAAAGSGLTYHQSGPWLGSIASTVGGLATVNGSNTFFLTDGTNGWLAFKGGAMDGAVVELAGVTTAPVATDFTGSSITVAVTSGSLTVAGVSQATGVLVANGTSAAGTAMLNSNDFANNHGSIEFDFYAGHPLSASQQILSLKSWNNAALLGASINNDGFLVMDVNGGTGGPSAHVTWDAWHHVAITYDGTSATLYLDGTAAGSLAGANLMTCVGKLILGQEAGDTALSAMFDNVKLWNTTLSPAQLADTHGLLASDSSNLVGHWSFNDGSTAVAENLAGNSYMDMVLGSSGHMAEPPMRAAHFDGSHAVAITHVATGSGPVTYEAWFRTTATGNTREDILAVGNPSVNNGAVYLSVVGGHVGFAVQGGSDISSDAIVNDGVWHHVAVTLSGSTATVYVDGVLDRTNPEITYSLAPISITSDAGYIGQGLGAGTPFTGDIGEVRVWDKTLSAVDVAEAMTNSQMSGHETGLIGYWKLDEGGGTTALNLHDPAHNGTYSAGTTWTNDQHADIVHTGGAQASALTFAGTQYASAGNIFNPATGDFTMAAWVNPTSPISDHDQMVIAKDTGAAAGTTAPVVSLYINSAGHPVFHMQGFDLVGTGVLSAGVWTHLSVTRSGDEYILSVNGVPVQAKTGPVLDLTNSYDLMIGARAGDEGGIQAATTFHGQIAGINLLASSMGPDETAASMHQVAADGDGLVASWSGTGVSDASGNGHSLTLSGVSVTAGSPPLYSQLVEVDGNTPYHGALVAFDSHGVALTYGLQTAPAHGTLTMAADGSFSYVPTAGYTGIDTFVLTASNGTTTTPQTVALDVQNPMDILGARQHYGVLSFNGNQAVTAGNSGALATLGSGDFTLEAWINPTPAALASEEILLSKQLGQGLGVPQLRLGLVGGHLFFMADNTTSGDGLFGSVYNLQSSQTLSAEQWAHVAVTRSGDEFTLYINGVADGSISFPFGSLANPAADLLIGQVVDNGIPSQGFKGEISDVQVWDRARSATELVQSYNREPDGYEKGLIAHWNGENGLSDASGNGHDLAQVTSGHPPSGHPPSGHALHFNGASTSVSMNAAASLSTGTGAFTLGTWIRTSTVQNSVLFDSGGPVQPNGISLWLQSDGHLLLGGFQSPGQASTGASVIDGNWHYVAVSYDGAGHVAYSIDGQTAGTSTYNNTTTAGFIGDTLLHNTINAVNLGGATWTAAYNFTGDMADVSVWNAQVTPPMTHVLTGTESNLLGNWLLNDATGTSTIASVYGSAATVAGTVTAVTDVDMPAELVVPQHAMHFDGSTSVATAAMPITGSHTVEAWIRTTNGAGGWDGGIFSTSSPSNSSGSEWTQMAIYDGKLAVEVATNGGFDATQAKSYVGTTNINDGLWHKVSYSVDTASNTLKLYVDGVQEGTSSLFGWDGSIAGFSANLPAQIGIMRDGVNQFSGDIADVRVWGAALSATQIQQTMNTELTGTEPGLLANWHLDGAGGTAPVVDAHGAANGTVTGSLTSVDTSTPIYDQMVDAEFGVAYHGTLAGVSPSSNPLTWHGAGAAAGATIASDGGYGTVTINADGSFTYTPATNWHGLDYFTVQATGADGTSVQKIIAVEVPSPVEALGVGAAGGSLQFNGSQYGTSTAVSLTGSSFSFEFWANRANAATNQTALFQNGALTVGYDSATTFTFNLAGSAFTVTPTAPVNQWTHWAGSYDSVTHVMSLYEDGHLLGTYAGPSSFSGTGPLYVGSDDATHGFVGQMDEIRLFGDVRSAAEVADDYLRRTAASDDHLLAEWHMDRVVNVSQTGYVVPKVQDDSGLGHDLSLSGPTGTDSTTPLYVNTAGKAAVFNGTSSSIHVAGNGGALASLGSGDFTLEGWVDPAAITGSGVLFSKEGNDVEFRLGLESGRLYFMAADTTGASLWSGAYLLKASTALAAGQWSHVAVTRAGNTFTLWIDGQSAASYSGQTFTALANTGGFEIGAFAGMMSDVRVWSTARTASEISSNMNNRLTGQEAGLVDNWRLDDISGTTVPDTTGHAAGTAASVSSASIKPSVYDDTISTREDTVTRGSLMAIDHDNAGAGLTATLTQQALHGTVTLSGLSYVYTPNAHYFGSDSFIVGVDDGSGTLTYQSIGISVKETHEAPQISGAGAFTVTENGSHGLGLSVADPIGGPAFQKYQVTLSAAHGEIDLSTTGGLTFTSGGNGAHSMTFSGSLDRVNAALAGASYSVDKFYSGADVLDLKVWDMSSDSIGDTLVSSVSDVITVAGANQAPILLPTRGVATFTATSAAASSVVASTQTDNITVEAWINWSGANGNANGECIFYNGDSSFSGYGLYVDQTGHLNYLTGGNGGGAITPTLSVGAWHHVALVRQGGVWSIVLDGVAYAPASQVGMNAFNTHPGATTIGNAGAGAGGNEGFQGAIADVQLWNVARDVQDIAGTMSTRLTGGEAGLVGLWTFETSSTSFSANLASAGLPGTGVATQGGAVLGGSGVAAYAIGGAATSGVLAAIDHEGAALTYTLTGGGSITAGHQTLITANGTIDLDTVHGSFTYTPVSGHTALETFGYSVTDGSLTTTGTAKVLEIDHVSTSSVASGDWTSSANWSSTLTQAGAEALLSGSALVHTTGSDEVGGLMLSSGTQNVGGTMTLVGSTLNLSGGTITVDVLGGGDSMSSLMISGGTLSLASGVNFKDMGVLSLDGGGLTGGGTMTALGSVSLGGPAIINRLDANLVLTKGGTMTGGSLTGSGNVNLTGGSLTLSGIGNDIGVAFQNAAASLLLVEAVAGGSSAVIEHGFSNQGAILLDVGATHTSDYTSSLTIGGSLTNDGALNAAGQGGGSISLIASTLDNYGQIGVYHDLAITTDSFLNHASLTLMGSTLTVQDGHAGTHTAFTNAGVVSGSGWINDTDATFINHGYIKPGDVGSAGTLHVTGDMTLASDSHVLLDVFQDGNGAVSNDLLWTSGTLALGGDLVVSDHGVHTTSATLLKWGAGSGEFGAIHGLDDSTNAWLLDPVFSGPLGGAGSLTLTGHAATVIGANAVFSDTGSNTDYVIGTGNNEELHLGSGADVFVGHGGGNTVGVSGTSFHFLDGGAGGNNQLVWEGGSTTTLDFTKLQVNALQNFDVLNLSAGTNNNAVLDLAHILSMTNGTNAVTGTAHSLVVIGSDQNNNHVSFADSGWHADGQVDLTVNNQHDSYTQYSNGTTHVLVDNHVSVG